MPGNGDGILRLLGAGRAQKSRAFLPAAVAIQDNMDCQTHSKGAAIAASRLVNQHAPRVRIAFGEKIAAKVNAILMEALPVA
jgi:hypothetical protein